MSLIMAVLVFSLVLLFSPIILSFSHHLTHQMEHSKIKVYPKFQSTRTHPAETDATSRLTTRYLGVDATRTAIPRAAVAMTTMTSAPFRVRQRLHFTSCSTTFFF